MSDALTFQVRYPARNFVVLWVYACVVVTAGLELSRGEVFEHPIVIALAAVVMALCCILGYLAFRFTPIAANRVEPAGIHAATVYGVSNCVPWEAIVSVDTVRLPIWSLAGDFAFIRVGKVVQLIGREYEDPDGFRRALDAWAPPEHPLRSFYLEARRS